MNEQVFGIGIDLGTSNSAISRVDISSGRPDFADAKDLGGHRDIPSVVYFHLDGTMEFGHSAAVRSGSVTEAPRVLTNVKLLLRSNEPITVEGLADPVEPRAIVRGLIAHLKSCAERTLNIPCTRAVISVPAHEDFDVDYRQMVRQAVMVGEPLFESMSTIPEPDAVLMSIGDLSYFVGKRLLVFDMGGGTLDVSIREVVDREGRPFLEQMAAIGSDAAGRRVTEALTSHVLDAWQRAQGFTFSRIELDQAKRMNYLSVDDAKKNLSNMVLQYGSDSPRAISCLLLAPDGRRPSYSVSVQAKELTALSKAVCEDAIETVQKALAKAGSVVEDIDHYFAVGGSAQLPLMRERLKEFFRSDPYPLQGPFGQIDSTLAVVRGAAVDDLTRHERDEEVLSKAPILERKIPYAISLLTDGRTQTSVLVPADSVLPFGPVERRFWLSAENAQSRSVTISLMRGDGEPQACTEISPVTVDLIDPVREDDPLEISLYIDEGGELIASAFDGRQRELCVIRANEY